MIMPQAIPAIKSFFSRLVVAPLVGDMLVRLAAAFIEHTGRMSATQAAGAIRTQAVHRAAVTRFLAQRGWGRDWQVLSHLAERLLEQEARRGGDWVFIVDQTYCSQQGDKTENTFSSGNRKRRPKKGRRHGKYKHTAKRCHGFVMGLLLTPSGLRVPSCRSYYTEDYCARRGLAYRTQIEWAAELIRSVPTPPAARVIVLGDTAFDAASIQRACRERNFTWVVPANPERVLAGPKPRPKARSLAAGLRAESMQAVRLQPNRGHAAVYRRLSRGRLGPKVKGRTYYVHAERRAVHSVGDVQLIFSTKELPKARRKLCVQKVLMTNAVEMSAAEAVGWYDLRWQIELFFKELKSTLGMHQYQFRNFVAVENWVQACLSTFAYLEWYRSRRRRRRGLKAQDRRWWTSQRTYGLCQAVRQSAERYDLERLEFWSRSPTGRKKLRQILRAARPLEYRAAA